MARNDVLLHEVYRIGSWGFAARLPAAEAKRIAADPDVIEVEPEVMDIEEDAVVTLDD